MEALLFAPISFALWYGVAKYVRLLNTRALLDSVRPTAEAVADAEFALPRMAGDLR